VHVDQSDLTDAELLIQLAAGDTAALSAVFDRHAAAVTRYAWALAENLMDVEEIVQDTFVTGWQKADGIFLPNASLLPWLLVTCRNHALNLNRKRARNRADELPDDLTSPHGDSAEEARDRLRWVMDEIDRLEPLDRQICELTLIEGRPYSEVAETVGISVGAVKQRVSRARTRLRKAVTDNEE
jgi:RNA polymerase sigma factor (sigma-70 family)